MRIKTNTRSSPSLSNSASSSGMDGVDLTECPHMVPIVELMASLEPHEEPERKPTVTPRGLAHAQSFEGDLLPALGLEEMASDSPRYAARCDGDGGQL